MKPRRMKHNLEFRRASAERMRANHANPKFEQARINGLRTPESRRRNSARMRALHNNPKFIKAKLEGIRAKFAEPEFAKAHAARNAERMRKLNVDPDFVRARAKYMRKNRCKACGLIKGKNAHQCKSVDLRKNRRCVTCNTRLRNKGYERYNKQCPKCWQPITKARQRAARIALKESFGGRCQICGYSRCTDALHFHHVNGRTDPQYGRGSVATKEVRRHPERFQLLCANCHFEAHNHNRKSKLVRSQEAP